MGLPMKNPYSGPDAIDTIVFDFDGTLADTLPSCLNTFKSTLRHLDIDLPGPINQRTFGHQSVAGMFHRAGISDIETLQTAIGQYHRLYREVAPKNARLFPGIRHTLNVLKDCGYGLAIATNESRNNLDMLLDTFKIGHIFSASCCADEVGQPKPSPDMGRRIMAKTGTTASSSLMVGDSVCDIEMARNNCMKSCAVSWGATTFDHLLESMPDWAITDITQLIDILNISRKVPVSSNIACINLNSAADLARPGLGLLS